MNIEEISLEMEKRKIIRDRIIEVKERIKKLEESKLVKDYKELKDYLDEYQEFDKNDDQILDDLIAGKVLDGDDTYFCFGRDFYGLPKKIGGYYIVERNPYRKTKRVSRYKSINNESKEVIILSSDTHQFEEENRVIYRKTNNPMEEYKGIRRAKVISQIREYQRGITKILK